MCSKHMLGYPTDKGLEKDSKMKPGPPYTYRPHLIGLPWKRTKTKATMENTSLSKCLNRRLLLMFYCCGLTLFALCALYTYALRSNSIRSSALGYVFTQELVNYPVNEVDKSNYTLININVETITNFSSDEQSLRKENLLKMQSAKRRLKQRVTISESAYDVSSLRRTQLRSIHQRHGTNMNISSCTSPSSKPKLILLWTTFFGSVNYFPNSAFGRCDKCTNCRVTSNRSLLDESDAVLFHLRDTYLVDLPTRRRPEQIWIFYCLESPAHSDFPGLQFMHNMFNWTMTYRSDSDIITQYGSIKKIPVRKPLNLAALQSAWKQKSRSVVWMASNCITPGRRENFIYQLKKFIDVDIFGSCGDLDCPRDSTEQCLRNFSKTYKFFLAFENSVCEDYVTEKFYRTLRYNLIPVVFGGAKYENYAPPGSYIDALSFKSPKHLAYFLAGVGDEFSLYSTYFRWKENYTVQLENDKTCSLCNLLHNDPKPSVYKDIRNWWITGGKCKRWHD